MVEYTEPLRLLLSAIPRNVVRKEPAQECDRIFRRTAFGIAALAEAQPPLLDRRFAGSRVLHGRRCSPEWQDDG